MGRTAQIPEPNRNYRSSSFFLWLSVILRNNAQTVVMPSVRLVHTPLQNSMPMTSSGLALSRWHPPGPETHCRLDPSNGLAGKGFISHQESGYKDSRFRLLCLAPTFCLRMHHIVLAYPKHPKPVARGLAWLPSHPVAAAMVGNVAERQ